MCLSTGEPYASKRADASYGNTPGTVCAVMTPLPPVLFCNRAERSRRRSCWLAGLCRHAGRDGFCFADNPENILAWLGRQLVHAF